METEKCRALLCALDTGSIAAAAEKLGYTASGISRMLSSLEAETGFSLLTRSRSGVVPTRECIGLLPIMREMVHQSRCYAQTAASICGIQTGSIVIGVSYGVFFRFLAKPIQDFRARYPGISFQTMEALSSELNTALETRQADLCVMSRREGAHTWLPLMRDELLFMLPCGHPLAGAASIPLSRIETETFIDIHPGKETDNSLCLARNGLAPRIRFPCSDAVSAMAMVEARMGITLIDESIAHTLRGDVCFVPAAPAQYVDVGVAVNEAQASPAARLFLSFLRQGKSTGAIANVRR